ncbi:MAG: APC family permease, partial [Elusimicrobiota bacterium]|nr:APC family permease [Elusimicrobiota bacterium]
MNPPPPSSSDNKKAPRFKQIMVLSTAMLSFISFWRAGAIVVCDFGSSAYYAGGIAMNAFGPAFPWFVLGVMLFAGVMLAVYVESCAMFVRGGVYVMVRHAMGKFMAKIAVSVLLFDFVLTGPISSIAAGLYIGHLLNSLLPMLHINWHISPNVFAVIFGVIVISYFWRANIKGIGESSDTNLKIVAVVSVIGAILLIWSAYTLYVRGFTLPPFTLDFSEEALGWTKHLSWLKPIGFIGLLMAFGHAILALSGLETLAQVYREIEDPKMKNLKKTATMVFIFSIIFTGVLTFMSALIIPSDLIATKYADNLLSGLALELHGPYIAKLLLQIVVVISGGLILVGAVNTSFVGGNGMLNRVAEDGILHDWFRKIHHKYGTTYRMISMIAITQILIVIMSRGDIFLLGEAYAFGVLWSLVFNTMALIILRFKDTEVEREWMFPLNIKVKNIYVPIGLMMVFAVLFITSIMNLLTKNIATVSGIIFSFVIFAVFQFSEKMNEKKQRLYDDEDDEPDEYLNLQKSLDINILLPKLVHSNRVLVPIRNPNNLVHLKHVLKNVDDETTDIIVMNVKVIKALEFGIDSNSITEEDKDLFTPVVLMAEKYGKRIVPLIVFSNDAFYSITQVALSAKTNEIVLGVSGSMGAEAQLERFAMAWGMLKREEGDKDASIKAKIIWEGRKLSCQL